MDGENGLDPSRSPQLSPDLLQAQNEALEARNEAEMSRKRNDLPRYRRPYTEAQMARARLVWEAKKKRCAEPGNCSGCGNPNDRTNRKTCSRCCQRVVARSRERLEERAKVMQGEMVEKLEYALKLIFQLRRELNALRSSFKLMRHSRAYIYQKAYKSGKQLGIRNGIKIAAKFQERLESGEREQSLGEITRQELATMSHAYDRKRG